MHILLLLGYHREVLELGIPGKNKEYPSHAQWGIIINAVSSIT